MELYRIKSPRNRQIAMFLCLVLISAASSLYFCIPLTAAQIPTTLPPFATDRDKFIEIAKPYIPNEVFNRGYFVSGLAGSTVENYVIVTFKISSVTKQELGWPEGPDTKFTNTGYLPQDTFNELQFKIDVPSENLILKEALDREPPPTGIFIGTVPSLRPNPWTWPTIASLTVLIGGMFALWLGLRRDKGNNEN